MKRPEFKSNWPESWKLSFYYDRMEVYDEVLPGQEGYALAYQARADRTLEMIKGSVPVGAKVLDVAAAQGNFTLRLAEAGYEVTWNDLRSELADYVRLKRESGLIHYRPGNILQMSAEGGQFDAILIAEVIEHVAHPDQFLRHISSLMKADGVIVMTTPNGSYFRNRLPRFSDCADPSQFEASQFKPDSDGHIFLLHDDEVHRIASQAGLEVRELRIFTNPLTQGHIKFRLFLPFLPKAWVGAVEQISEKMPLAARRRVHSHLAALLRRHDAVGRM